jgi:hypothetical protein
MLRFGVLLAVLSLSCASLAGQDMPKQKGMVCWQLHFAGISVAVTDDEQLQRLMGGAGVFRPDEGHSGGRYYVDAKSEFTLHVELGVDRIVEAVTVSKGVNKALTANERKAAISKYFYPTEGFGNWHALHMGSNVTEVLENLGEPKEKQKNGRIWSYESVCSCEIPHVLSVEFRKDSVSELVLSAEE